MKSTMTSKLTSKLTSNKGSKPSPISSTVPNASDSVSASDSARASDNDHERHAYAQFDNRSGFVQFFAAFWYSARREWDFLVQNRWDFSLMFWMPIVLIFLVWWIFSKGMAVGIPIAVIDNDHSAQSATIIRYIDATPEVAVVKSLHSAAAAQQAIETTDVMAVVEIPENFSTNLLAGKTSRLLLNVNAQYGTHSGMIQKAVQTAVTTFSAGAEMQRRVAIGEDVTLTKTSYAPIQSQSVALFNTANNYQQFLAVTVVPALLHILSMVIGASTVGRELVDKTLGEWYQSLKYPKFASNHASNHASNYAFNRLSNPSHPVTLGHEKPKLSLIIAGLNGKLIWAMFAYTLWAAVALTLVMQIFPIRLASVAITYLIFLMFMMVSFWLGVIVTVGTFSYRQGLSFTGFISAPSFAFSGVTFPFLAMSPAAQRWANALPLTHYLNLQTTQLQMGAPPSFAYSSFMGFFIAVMITLLLAALLTKKALLKPEKWGQR
ncbi:ABC transporter permease [Moraxella osloensis]|uniref:ABC transporter permease n=1 Tax=Faucicola osloensis TaxID=34062 RepID=A0AAD0EXF0_FAUOS|nr:ABC transporter permease [Moraxella osloensis]ATW84944.1 ABC transporter permease [Moraxella osloensis]